MARGQDWPSWYNGMMVIPAFIMTPIWLAQGVAEWTRKLGRRHGKKASRRTGATGLLSRKRRRARKTVASFFGRKPSPKPKTKKKGKSKGRGAGKTDMGVTFTIQGKSHTVGARDGGKAAVERVRGIKDNLEQIYKQQGFVSR